MIRVPRFVKRRGLSVATTRRWLVIRMPGYPAFLMSTANQKREAFTRFSLVVLFSIIPLLLIGYLNGISAPDSGFFSSLGQYTEAGQIYFYIGAIIGSAFLLVRDNFKESSRRSPGKLTAGEEIMRTERTWFTLYMICVAVASTVILSVYHLKVDKNPAVIYWSSGLIYLVSLYVWFIDILYSQINPAEASLESVQEDDNGGGGKVDENIAVSRIEDALNSLNVGDGN